MTFPRDEGQIPIYYNHYITGRPAKDDQDKIYVSAYIDLPNSPKFPFGFGLSYTTFQYSDLKLSQSQMQTDGSIDVEMKLTNTGKYAGAEVVQLYIKDIVGSVVRPILELKDFQKVNLAPGETQTLHFKIDKEKLSFFNQKLEWTTEPGAFELMIGSSSADIRLRANFELTN
jgi:beta-glucosidase